MTKKLCVLHGDGIGPEVVRAALMVFEECCARHGVRYELEAAELGGCAIDTTGKPLPEDTLRLAKAADAVLLGAVGGPRWDALPGDQRPEAGLLGIRAGLGLYANLRPAYLHRALASASPLKPELLENGLDLLVVRELTGGLYFGKRGRFQENGVESAYDTECYSVPEIERIAHTAFQAAQKRGKRLCSVDKANVLESSRLWRATVLRVAEAYTDVELSHMYVDNAAMQLVRNPAQFDVIVTSNLFGDILSDEASMLTGSIGMLPSASLGEGTRGLYEPIHGSAPDIAGRGIANPLATILSIAMMLRYSLHLPELAEDIESAVTRALDEGARTADIAKPGETVLGTIGIAQRVIGHLRA